MVKELTPLTSISSDEKIDRRVQQTARYQAKKKPPWKKIPCSRYICSKIPRSTCHPAGTSAMREVVDAELEFMRVKGLRVCDTSIFPAPVAAHPMAALYAIAEQTAELNDYFDRKLFTVL